MPVDATIWRAIVLCTVLNPGVLYVCVIWGQSDLIVCDLVLLSMVALLRHQDMNAGGLWMTALLIKIQAAFAFPALVAVSLVRHRYLAVAGVLAALLAVLPATFSHGGLIAGYGWLAQIYTSLRGTYAFVTLNAGTLPGFIVGYGGEFDSLRGPAGIAWISWANACDFAVAVSVIAAIVRERQRLTGASAFWYLAASQLGIYYFATRMHSRYLMYGDIAILAVAFISRRRAAIVGLDVDLGFTHSVRDSIFAAVPHRYVSFSYGALNLCGVIAFALSFPARVAAPARSILPAGASATLAGSK